MGKPRRMRWRNLPPAQPTAGTAYAAAAARHCCNVVSEKTGYPVEMLELDMDMEADLGINSIKRVEILGAMRAQFPQLPQARPRSLREVRTLGQIHYMAARGPARLDLAFLPSAAPAQTAVQAV